MNKKEHKLKGNILIQEYGNGSYAYFDTDVNRWRNIPASLAKNLIQQLRIRTYSELKSKYLRNSKGEFRYCFNWIGGGFNDEWAKTKAEAIKKAESGTSLRVDRSTCSRVTEEQSRVWDYHSTLATC